jgi:hypothetical protein
VLEIELHHHLARREANFAVRPSGAGRRALSMLTRRTSSFATATRLKADIETGFESL